MMKLLIMQYAQLCIIKFDMTIFDCLLQKSTANDKI